MKIPETKMIMIGPALSATVLVRGVTRTPRLRARQIEIERPVIFLQITAMEAIGLAWPHTSIRARRNLCWREATTVANSWPQTASNNKLVIWESHKHFNIRFFSLSPKECLHVLFGDETGILDSRRYFPVWRMCFLGQLTLRKVPRWSNEKKPKQNRTRWNLLAKSNFSNLDEYKTSYHLLDNQPEFVELHLTSLDIGWRWHPIGPNWTSDSIINSIR